MGVSFEARQFHGLGGAQDQEELYELAARMQVLRPDRAAARLGWSIERTDQAVRLLAEAKLLQPLPGDECAFRPVPPRAAAYRRLAPLQEQIQRMERRSREIQAELVGFHRAREEALGVACDTDTDTDADSAATGESGEGFGWAAGRETLRMLIGEEALQEEITAALSSCARDVLLARPGTGWWATTMQHCAEASIGSLQRRDVDVRVIQHHAARFDPATRKFAAVLSDGGGAVRTLAGPFEGVILIDRQVAIVPLEEAHLAVVVHQPGLVRFMVEVFERTWRVAKDFAGQCRTTEVSKLVSDVQGAIIQLLAEGKTDEVIARRIGVSVRTCRHHIAKIYDELGARSRFQLGVMIARSGLLEQVQNGPHGCEAGAVRSLTAT